MASRSYSMPPSKRTRPAPIVSGSWVTSGRCCANALAESRRNRDVMVSVRMSELTFAVDENRYRSVVDQFNVHHCLELARGHGQLSRPQFSHDALVQCARIRRRRRRIERRTPALPDVAVEGELGDDEHAAADVRDRAIHLLARLALEIADVADFSGDVGDVLVAVVAPDTDQDNQPRAYLAHHDTCP